MTEWEIYPGENQRWMKSIFPLVWWLAEIYACTPEWDIEKAKFVLNFYGYNQDNYVSYKPYY